MVMPFIDQRNNRIRNRIVVVILSLRIASDTVFFTTDKPLQCGYRVIVGSPVSNNTAKIGFEGDGKPTRHPITTSPTAAGAEKEKRRGLGRLNRLFRSFCLIWGLSFSRSLKIVQVTPVETSAWH